jgi:hypothetical protein
MNSQELRALQEAYSQVYDNKLCEELTGSRLQTAVEKKASSRLTHGFHGSHTDDGKITKFQTKLGGKGKKGKGKSGLNLPGYELDRGTGNKAARRAGKFVKNTRDDGRDSWDESFDIYDVILSHLLDEGYADTQEQAEAIMVNMSEEWRQSIIG